ncbi:MAG TPA: hypothetical protein DDW87_08830 [Firmicutes bacterium]|nr:hypothetical protein [Bacillota bacterium]
MRFFLCFFYVSSRFSRFPSFIPTGFRRRNHICARNAKKVIAAGRSVVTYPEGVISSGPQMAQFKRGAFRLGQVYPSYLWLLAAPGRSWAPKNDTI